LNKIFYQNDKIIMSFKPKDDILQATRRLKNRRYDPLKRHWEIDPSDVKSVVEIGKKFNFTIDKKILVLVENPPEPYRIELYDNSKVVFLFPYSIEIKNAIREIPSSYFNRKDRKWYCSVNDRIYIMNFVRKMKRELNIDFHIDKGVKSVLNKDQREETLEKRRRKIRNFMKYYEWPQKPFKHQIDGVVEALVHMRYGIFDEQGLGKTYQALVVRDVLNRIGINKCLIICPNSLKRNWLKEIIKSFPSWYENDNINIVSKSMSKSIKDRFRENLFSREISLEKDINIINYESVRLELERISKFVDKKTLLIFDESHRVGNPGTQVTIASLSFSSQTNRKLLLSGTPVSNKPENLWSQLRIIEAPVASTYRKFKSAFCNMGFYGVSSYKNLNLLREVVSEVSVRRLKADCLDLPEKTVEIRYIGMEREQEKLYRQMQEKLYIEIMQSGKSEKLTADFIFSKIIRLVQLASNPALLTENYNPNKSGKMGVLDTIIQENTYYDGYQRKVVISTSFIKNVEFLMKKYKNYNPVCIYGGISSDKRQDIVDKFQNDDNCKLFIGIPSAFGTGFTLTSAQTLVFYDKNFSRVDYNQAMERIHRIGTKGSVSVIHLICENTIDEFIWEKLQQKDERAGFLQGDYDTMKRERSRLTEEELKRLLG